MLMNFGSMESPKVQGEKRENSVFELYFFAHNNDENGGVFLQNKGIGEDLIKIKSRSSLL
ncbi:hypothetical protein CCY01nite_47450 [Chitinophaga cymbidii]|uniref:Uncharacterized protein n=1 Tax=Chitinophaga cymbidii TaxID=1096750 RepID=A0A512RS12_9BACT|nr:hypothetical protein CCY01nite_47450 [Chitinophaga cymbidii]